VSGQRPAAAQNHGADWGDRHHFRVASECDADAAGLVLSLATPHPARGKEAIHSNQAIVSVMLERHAGVCPGIRRDRSNWWHADRDAIRELLSQVSYIDLCMPRGRRTDSAVAECSRVPVIKHYKGVCHVYVDETADPSMAEAIVLNAKTQRPGVCNAMETLLVDRAVAPDFCRHRSASNRAQSGIAPGSRGPGLLQPLFPA